MPKPPKTKAKAHLPAPTPSSSEAVGPQNFEIAIIVLEREANAFVQMERTLDRQLRVFPPGSKQHQGAQTAMEEVKTRISALKAGIAALKH